MVAPLSSPKNWRLAASPSLPHTQRFGDMGLSPRNQNGRLPGGFGASDRDLVRTRVGESRGNARRDFAALVATEGMERISPV